MRFPGPKNPKNWQNLQRVAKLGLVQYDGDLSPSAIHLPGKLGEAPYFDYVILNRLSALRLA
jgi:hypothetical protein